MNESQLRPLSPLEPEQRREVWSHAVEAAPNGKPTAADVKAVVNRLFPSHSNGVLPGRTTFLPESDAADEDEPDPADRTSPGFDSWLRFYNDQLTFFASVNRRGGMGLLSREWSEGQRLRMAAALEHFMESAADFIDQLKGVDE